MGSGYQLGVELEDLFCFQEFFMANVEGFKAVSINFLLFLEVAISNGFWVTPGCYGTS